MNYTRLQDGSVAFHRRGATPPDIPNYTRDPSDPYLFHPSFPECRHRLLEKKTGPCGRVTGQRWHCVLLGGTVSVPICNNCEVRES